MSSSWWPRRPSAPDTTIEPPSPPRQRTTSGSMAVLASAFGLSKHKSRERLRVGTSSLPNRTGSTPPALVSSSRPRSANNRQTVVSTGSSDYPEPTTPSSASDTKRSFQSSTGPGFGVPGDDPFARSPVYVAESSRKKEKQPERPQERVRKLGVSQGDVRRIPSASGRPSPTHRAHSGGAESHLSPPTPHLSSKTSLPHLSRQPSGAQLSPGSSTSHLSPKSSSSYLSASTAPTTFSNSSTLFSGFSPTTSPIALSPTSALDIYAHATATQSYSYSPDSNPSPLEEVYARAMASSDRLAKPDDELDLGPPALGIRRGQSAHAVLTRPSIPNLSTQPSNPNIGLGRGGMGVASMASMVGLASGIVQEVRDVPALHVSKRSSRNELRSRTSTSSLVNPPPRTSSRRGSENDTSFSRRGSDNDTSTLSVPTVQEQADELLALPSPHSSQSGSPGPSNAHLYSPPPFNPSLSPGPSNIGSPRSSPVNFGSPGASRHTTPTARKSEDLDNYQFAPITHDEASIDLTALGFEDDVYSDTESRFGLEDPRFGMDDPRLALDDSRLGASPRFGATLHPSTAMHPDPLSLIDPENIQLDGHPLFPPESPRSGTKYARSPSIRPVHLPTSPPSRSLPLPTNPPSRPPPSPTNLPWMAGNAGRRRKLSSSEVAYPSGMHIIPMAAKMDLARLGKEEDAVMGIGIIEEGVDVGAVLEAAASEMAEKGPVEEALEDDEFPTPPASAPPSSPSPVNPLTRIPSASSRTSSCSSIAPEMMPPQNVSSRIEFSRHTRSGSYSDSEVDLDPMPRARTQVVATSTSVAWKCGSGNHEKCCSTRALREGVNAGRWKCCAVRTSGKNARCCAAVVGLPCQRPRVSSTSSASVNEAGWGPKRQRSYHMPTLPGMGGMGSPGPSHARGKRFFHRPHTSHAKSTSSALLDDETKSMIRAREDPGPSIAPVDEVFAPIPVASPPISPMSRHEFRAQHIISPAALQDHLKEMRSPLTSPAPPSEPGLKSPKLEPSRQRSNTTTTNVTTTDTTGSIHSTFSDSPAPMRSLPLPRRTHNTSLPVMPSSQAAPPPRRYVQSISTVMQPSRAPPPPPRSPIGALPRPPLGAPPRPPVGPPVQRASAGSGLPPPPRGRVGTQPIVSFISSHSAPTPQTNLRHHSSRESCASSNTVRRERSIPLRENQMSFLDIGVEEEDTEEEEEDDAAWSRPALQHSQSFLDLSSRQSGDTMRDSVLFP